MHVILKNGRAVASAEDCCFARKWARKHTKETGVVHEVMSTETVLELRRAHSIIDSLHEILKSVEGREGFEYAIMPMSTLVDLREKIEEHQVESEN